MIKILFYLCLIYPAHITPTVGIVQNFYWRDYLPGDIPSDAYEGAPGKYIGQILVSYNCTTFHEAATIYSDAYVAVGEYLGKRTYTKDIKILCSPDNTRFYWEYVDFNATQDQQLTDAVIGGYEYPVNLYIGKALDEGEWKISKVNPFTYKENKGLWVWDKNEEPVGFQQCFVLKYNTTKCDKKQITNPFVGNKI